MCLIRIDLGFVRRLQWYVGMPRWTLIGLRDRRASIIWNVAIDSPSSFRSLSALRSAAPSTSGPASTTIAIPEVAVTSVAVLRRRGRMGRSCIVPTPCAAGGLSCLMLDVVIFAATAGVFLGGR